ncbi:hypothetical protein INR49_032536, partial [Caranx melampygus]
GNDLVITLPEEVETAHISTIQLVDPDFQLLDIKHHQNRSRRLALDCVENKLPRMRVVCALGLFMTLLHLSAPLLLGAFNIKSFGDKKASNTTLMNLISTIIRRYDIILIQEVRDSDLSVIKKIMDHVNRGSNFTYKHNVSEPLGPSTYKERYLFLYREQTADVVQSYTYEDPAKAFTRKPFVVMLSSRGTVLKNFVLIPQHTCPKLAVKEVDALYDVVTDVRNCCKTNNIVLLGDFNAGCTYVKRTDWQQIRLFTNKSFHWLITDAADTTVSHSNCPYDRIVVTSDMMKGVVPNSAAVYDYMKDLSLSQKEVKGAPALTFFRTGCQ